MIFLRQSMSKRKGSFNLMEKVLFDQDTISRSLKRIAHEIRIKVIQSYFANIWVMWYQQICYTERPFAG